MKNLTQLFAVGIIVLFATNVSNAQNQGPILAEKLEMPEKIVIEGDGLTDIDKTQSNN